MFNSIAERLLDKMAVVANNPKYLLTSAITVLFTCAAGYWLFENVVGGRSDEGPIRSLWWAVVTASTVGYGDAYPETTAGRGVAVLLIVAMVTLILPMITALFTAKLVVDRDAFTHEEQEEIKRTLALIAAKLDIEPTFESVAAADLTDTTIDPAPDSD